MQIASPPRTARPACIQAEIQVLRTAAAVLDLQDSIAEPVRELPSVQAMVRAAAAVFAELGFTEADGVANWSA